MSEETRRTVDVIDVYELSIEEIEATSGAGLLSWLRSIFGGNDSKPARGPFNRPDDHLK